VIVLFSSFYSEMGTGNSMALESGFHIRAKLANVFGIPGSALFGLAEYFEVDMLGVWYKQNLQLWSGKSA